MEYYKKKLTGEERKKLGMTLFPPMDRLKLPDALRCERLREDVIKDIAADPKMFARFEKLEPEDQEMLLEFFMGNRGLNVLYDPFFKKIMNQERLEKFLEQVMGQPVKIVRIIPTGELQQSAEGSVMIMDMMNKNAAKYDDLNQFAQEFFEKLIAAGIRCRHVQAEIILNRLIRDANNLYKRPDFTQFKMPEYKILTLNQALMNSEAPTVPFSYQELKRQILSDALYEEKKGSSYLDPLYSDKVSTENFKKYAKLVRERRQRKDEQLKRQREGTESSS